MSTQQMVMLRDCENVVVDCDCTAEAKVIPKVWKRCRMADECFNLVLSPACMHVLDSMHMHAHIHTCVHTHRIVSLLVCACAGVCVFMRVCRARSQAVPGLREPS